MLYVLEAGGEVPSYNFYLKILNTWIRKGIKTTEEVKVEIYQFDSPFAKISAQRKAGSRMVR